MKVLQEGKVVFEEGKVVAVSGFVVTEGDPEDLENYVRKHYHFGSCIAEDAHREGWVLLQDGTRVANSFGLLLVQEDYAPPVDSLAGDAVATSMIVQGSQPAVGLIQADESVSYEVALCVHMLQYAVLSSPLTQDRKITELRDALAFFFPPDVIEKAVQAVKGMK